METFLEKLKDFLNKNMAMIMDNETLTSNLSIFIYYAIESFKDNQILSVLIKTILENFSEGIFDYLDNLDDRNFDNGKQMKNFFLFFTEIYNPKIKN